MNTWFLPLGWLLLLLDPVNSTATCKNSDGEIIVIDLNGA